MYLVADDPESRRSRSQLLHGVLPAAKSSTPAKLSTHKGAIIKRRVGYELIAKIFKKFDRGNEKCTLTGPKCIFTELGPGPKWSNRAWGGNAQVKT